MANISTTTKEWLNFSKINQEYSRLTIYSVHSRYPFSIDIEEKDMYLALFDAETVVNFVETALI